MRTGGRTRPKHMDSADKQPKWAGLRVEQASEVT
jgi:hypothetical protein